MDRNERTSFHDYMRFSEGKADETPIAVEDVFLLEKDEFSPLYVAELSRWRWHNGHEDENGLAGEAGYEAVRNYWLVEFSSDDIRVLREARWLYQIIDRDKKLRDCRNG